MRLMGILETKKKRAGRRRSCLNNVGHYLLLADSRRSTLTFVDRPWHKFGPLSSPTLSRQLTTRYGQIHRDGNVMLVALNLKNTSEEDEYLPSKDIGKGGDGIEEVDERGEHNPAGR
jgi:hypothetical protein